MTTQKNVGWVRPEAVTRQFNIVIVEQLNETRVA